MTGNASRGAPTGASSALQFTPVRLRYRRDGWTPARQIAFIVALSACRCVLEACRRVGASSESAYKLYRRPDAESFRRAWDEAIAGVRPPQPPSTSAAPSTSAPAAPARPPRAPSTAIAFWPAPAGAALQPPWISSTSSTSSPSGAGPAETNGMCPGRQLHQLPRGHQLPAGGPPPGASVPAEPRRPRPAYSLEGSIRAARRRAVSPERRP